MMIIKDKNNLSSFIAVAFIVVAWTEKGNSHHSFFTGKHPFQMQVDQRDRVERFAHGLIFAISSRLPYANRSFIAGKADNSGYREIRV